MTKYIHFTEEEKRQANDVDLEAFLKSRGERLIPSGHEKRLESNHSITIRGNKWCDHAEEAEGGKRRGGHAISFVQYHYGLSYPEAVQLLLGGSAGMPYPTAEHTARETKRFELPPAASNMRRVFAYLVKTRGIDRDVVTAFAKAGLVYEDEKYHNAVFVGTDESGVPRHAHKRSTNADGQSFRQTVEGSDFHYTFHWCGTSDRLYVFEAPIDMLSYITMHPENWQEHSYVACCGTSSIPVLKMLERLPAVTGAALCHDNDKAGEAAAQRLEKLLEDKGIASGRMRSVNKDWNLDLTAGVTIIPEQQAQLRM